MVDTAKFAETSRVSVFAERTPTEFSVFVRDRGVGFDPAAVPSTRRGIADSIVRRVESAGGTALVRSARYRHRGRAVRSADRPCTRAAEHRSC